MERTCAKKEYFEKSLIIAVLGIFVLIALAAPATAAEGINITEQWNMTFGGAGDDYGYSVQQTADGGYILAGDTRSYGAGDADVWLIKTDSKGNEQWSRTFGGAEADLLDRGSVRQTSDGGYVITGYTHSYGAGDADVWLIKTNSDGHEQWKRTFGGEGLDWGHSVQQTSDGGYVIAGRIIPPYAGDRADAWLIKTDSNGVEQWNRTFGADGCEYAASVQQTADDGYIMTGRTTSFGADEADAWLIRTDSNGTEQWNRTFGGAGYDYGYSVQQTADGGYVIAGSTNGRQDVWLIKTHPDGTEEWNTIFGFGSPAKADEGYSVQQTSDGGYILAGYTESYGTAGSADVWLIRTDSDGIEQWNMTVGGTGLEKGYSVHQTADGDYIAAGYTNSFGAGGYDLWLIKLSTPIVWQYEGLVNPIDAERVANNNTLITEFGNHSVVEVTPTGETVWRYGDGTAGSGENQLNSPVDAERLASGSTLITDRSNHRVIEVTQAGEIVWQYGTTGTSGSGADQLHNPMDAERLSNGNTLIADRLNNRVIEVNPAKEIVWQYGITHPFDADRLHNNNTLFVEYTNHRVIEVNSTGEVVWQYGTGTAGSGANELNYPEDAERLSNGNTLITDSLNHRVIEVNPAKEIVWQYGTTGTAGSKANELNHPRDAERLPLGNTLIADWGNSRVIEVRAAPEEEEEEEEIDLVPTALGTPPTLYANLTNTITATIKNNGTGDASSLFNVSLSANGSTVDKASVSGLNAGESVVVNLYWTPSRIGDFELCVSADCDLDVNESNETNNVLCENVTVFSFEHPCWNDSFEDETKIAEMQNVVVSKGDIKIDLENVSWLWRSDSSASGLPINYSSWGEPAYCYTPAVAFNITGDGRWNLIVGNSSGEFHGFYWNDSAVQWISDSSLVAGLGGVGSYPAPAIAFNITGDGKWNLIAGNSSGEFHGFYWNDSSEQWISDSSLVTGLGDVGNYSVPAIAFNIKGDGTWNLISGNSSGEFNGFYWNGMQWISDSSLVAGLGSVGSGGSFPAIAFNITWDGKWNLISGSNREYSCFYGYYWNGSLEQWVSDSSLVAGLPSGRYDYRKVPAVAFNITGDEGWNLISGVSGICWYCKNFWRFSGYARATQPGSVKSVLIQPSHLKNWGVFNANASVPTGTDIIYKILDENNNTIMDVVDGQNISSITQTSIRLYAELTTTNISHTPVLHDWGVCWETGEVDLLPTAIETPAELYANVTVIGAVISNYGDAHSGPVEFNIALHANEVEVDSKRMVVDGMPPGGSRDIVFSGWTPPQPGNYNLTVVVDSDNEIVESNEGNNELTKEVTVMPSTVRRLTFDANSSINPSIAMDSEGNLHVVWSEDRGGYQLYYKKLAPNGMVLVDDKRICGGSGVRIAVDSSGNVHVVYKGIAYPYPPYYLKLDNVGNILIEPELIIQPQEYYSYSAKGIAVDLSGNVHAAVFFHMKQRTGEEGITYIKLDNEGNVLVNYTVDSVHLPYGGAREYIRGPSGIAVDSEGNAYTAYMKGPGGCEYSYSCDGFACRWPTCAKVWYAKIDGDGVHLQELTGELPLPSVYPSVCVDSGDNKHVMWSQHNRSGTVICPKPYQCYIELYGFDFYYTKFDKFDNKVIDGKRLTYEDYPVESSRLEGVRGVRSPVIDTESGVIHTAWSVPEPKAGEDKNIWYMAFDTSGDEMTNKTLISFEDGDSWEPGIVAVQDGAHLVWTDNRDENNEIYYARMFLPPDMVFLTCPPDKWTAMNVTATYSIGIMHTMPNTETFNLTLDNLDGADVAELNKSTITLDPNSIGEVILNVTDAVLGDYWVTVSVASQTNPEIKAECTITTSVAVATPNLIITALDAYHNNTAESPWFNLSNEVDVEVKNIGEAPSGAFNVSLYADAEYVDKKRISDLGTGSSTILQFKWTPVGADCFKDCSFTDTSREYNLTVAADCDNEVNESDETNNNLTEVEKACYNGYMADEPLENVAHGLLHGGLLFTTGDGTYGGLYSPGDSIDTTYEVTLPAGASVELARLNVYYTWHYEKDSCPAMEVSITNEFGTYVVPLDRDYNDIKCQHPGVAWVFPWGNYVYNLTDYIQGNGTYTVTVKRTGGPSFCIAAPGIEVLYEDETRPLIEYWINEGADVLIGGRRGDGGHLSLEECINNATFPGNVDAGKVEKATLGVVSPWGGAGWTPGMTNYLFFNDVVLGRGVYHGYSETYSEAIGGISMHIGSTGAQVGVNLSDVTDYLLASDNRVGQGDDGDNMMPCNAFLVVEYGEEPPPTAFMVYGWVNDSTGAPVLNPNVTITNLNTAEVFIVETNASSNYYQVLTTSENVNAGNVLHFYASDNGNKTEFNHTITQEEMDTGGFEQNITVAPDTTPPASITNLHNTSYALTYITWSWTNPADADFNYTMVYLNGTCVTNTSYPFYNATGLNPDTAYEIGTRTVDRAGNVNLSWVNHSARTAPGVQGVCGDVTGDGKVRMSDGRLIYRNQTYPGMYPVDEWAADVTGDGKVRMSDGRQIYQNQTYPGMYPLTCK